MKNKFFDDFKRFLYLMEKNKKPFLIISVLKAAFGSLINLIFAFATKKMVDFFVDSVPNSIRDAIISVFLLIIVGGILVPVFIFLSKKMYAKIINDVRINLFEQFQNMPVKYFEAHHSGDVLARVNKDINALETAYLNVDTFIYTIVRMLLFIPYIVVLDYRFAIFSIVIGILSMLFNLKLRVPMRERSKEIHGRNSEMTEQMTDNVTGFNVIKSYGLDDIFYKKYLKRMNDVFKSQLKVTNTEAFLYSTNSLVGWLGMGGVGLIGCYWVIHGSLSAGNLMGIIFIASELSGGLVKIASIFPSMQKSFAGSDRIYEVLNEPIEPERYDTKGTGSKSGVEIKDGVFSYDGNEKVINGLNINVEKGKTAALVGYSGGGKSTAIKLLLGLYEMSAGQITIDGKGMNEYKLNELRDKMAYVPQDAYIFNGTIKENISYGNPDPTEEEIINASKKANDHAFIMEQKDKYETVVGERGIRLSGGQRQRVAIARAILKNAPILLLDEATSSLDSESENLVQDALEKLMKGCTSIVVAHRLSTIENADIIYFIEGGKVVEEGNHLELLALNKKYAELFRREFKNKE